MMLQPCSNSASAAMHSSVEIAQAHLARLQNQPVAHKAFIATEDPTVIPAGQHILPKLAAKDGQFHYRVLSDLHLGCSASGLNCADTHFEALLRMLQNDCDDVRLLILNGDILEQWGFTAYAIPPTPEQVFFHNYDAFGALQSDVDPRAQDRSHGSPNHIAQIPLFFAQLRHLYESRLQASKQVPPTAKRIDIVFIPGNHDNWFRYDAGFRQRTLGSDQAYFLHYCDTKLEIHNVSFEHGHVYDAFNCDASSYFPESVKKQPIGYWVTRAGASSTYNSKDHEPMDTYIKVLEVCREHGFAYSALRIAVPILLPVILANAFESENLIEVSMKKFHSQSTKFTTNPDFSLEYQQLPGCSRVRDVCRLFSDIVPNLYKHIVQTMKLEPSQAREEVYRMFQATLTNYQPYFVKWSDDYEADRWVNTKLPALKVIGHTHLPEIHMTDHFCLANIGTFVGHRSTFMDVFVKNKAPISVQLTDMSTIDETQTFLRPDKCPILIKYNQTKQCWYESKTDAGDETANVKIDAQDSKDDPEDDDSDQTTTYVEEVKEEAKSLVDNAVAGATQAQLPSKQIVRQYNAELLKQVRDTVRIHNASDDEEKNAGVLELLTSKHPKWIDHYTNANQSKLAPTCMVVSCCVIV